VLERHVLACSALCPLRARLSRVPLGTGPFAPPAYAPSSKLQVALRSLDALPRDGVTAALLLVRDVATGNEVPRWEVRNLINSSERGSP
jgi:hypothetical protein